MPIPKIHVSESFLLFGIWSRHNIGIGRIMIDKSSKRLKIAVKRKDMKKSPQTPFSSFLQSKSKGLHMAKKVIKTPVYHMAANAMMICATRRND